MESPVLDRNPNQKESEETSQEPNWKARSRYGPNEGRRIFKNLIVLAIAFILLFTSYSAIANLASSLNEEAGLGVYSLATIYVGLSFSSLFLPSLVIRKFSCKWTLVFSMIGYMIFNAAQFYPTFWTLIPAGFIIGICAAPLWAAQSIYLTKIGEEYSYLTSTSVETVLQRFFGLFYLFFQSCQIWGNLTASVLMSSAETINEFDQETDLSHCGSNYCPLSTSKIENANASLEVSSRSTNKQTDMDMIYFLYAIFLGFSIIGAFIVWFFVDSLKRYGEDESSGEEKLNSMQLVLATFRHWKIPNQLLLIPATFWMGFQSGFIGGDFNLGFVTCALGVRYIGYIMIAYGITDAISSFTFGRITKYTGRAPVFILAAGLTITSFVLMLTWAPSSERPDILFIIVALWGMSDGIWLPQLTALYGSLFPTTKEAAFSNSRFWTSMGYVTAYVIGTIFCMTTKIYIGIVLILVSLCGYLVVEMKLRFAKKETDIATKSIGNNNL